MTNIDGNTFTGIYPKKINNSPPSLRQPRHAYGGGDLLRERNIYVTSKSVTSIMHTCWPVRQSQPRTVPSAAHEYRACGVSASTNPAPRCVPQLGKSAWQATKKLVAALTRCRHYILRVIHTGATVKARPNVPSYGNVQ
eukprot:5040614-Pyramimonas_sp.AAC.1